MCHPIFGVGFGQYGFYASDFYPQWAWESSEISQWGLNTLIYPKWPPVHGLYARILSELGIVGFCFWIVIWIKIFRDLLKFKCRNLNIKDEIRVKCLIISLIGTLLTGFVMDSFHFFSYWIIVGVYWVIISSYKEIEDETRE